MNGNNFCFWRKISDMFYLSLQIKLQLPAAASVHAQLLLWPLVLDQTLFGLLLNLFSFCCCDWFNCLAAFPFIVDLAPSAASIIFIRPTSRPHLHYFFHRVLFPLFLLLHLLLWHDSPSPTGQTLLCINIQQKVFMDHLRRIVGGLSAGYEAEPSVHVSMMTVIYRSLCFWHMIFHSFGLIQTFSENQAQGF